jgi:hypothetical protein
VPAWERDPDSVCDWLDVDEADPEAVLDSLPVLVALGVEESLGVTTWLSVPL